MAENRQRGLLQVVAGRSVGARVASGGTSVPSSGAAQAAGQQASALGSIANDLSAFANQVGAYADHAAAVEGARQGRKDGASLAFDATRQITIRGEAYDRAGLQVYEKTVGLEIENDIASGGDLAAKRDAWLKGTPEELHPEIAHRFRRAEVVQAREALRAEQAEATARLQRATVEEIDQSVKGLHQRAFSLGLDKTADELLAKDLALLENTLQQRGADGKPLVSPTKAFKILKGARDAVNDARLHGEFSRLPSLEAQAEFIAKLETDWQAGEGIAKSYDFSGFQRITGQLSRGLKAGVAQRKMQTSAIIKDIDEMSAWLKRGYSPSPDQLAGIKARVEASADPNVERRLSSLENMAEFHGKLVVATPDEIAAVVDEIDGKIKEKGPSEVALAHRELADSVLEEMRTELKTNPLGWAERVGLVPQVPLDLSTAETAATSLKARIVQAEQVADLYGQEPVYLTPDDKQQLATIIAKGGNQTVQVASTIATHAGQAAPAIMAEFAQDAPTVAAIGGHVVNAGVTPIAKDAADGLTLMHSEGFRKAAPEPKKAKELAAAVLGTSAGRMPRNMQALVDMANAAYETRARRLGKGELDEDLWSTALREAIGERLVGGVTYGGRYRFSWWSGRGGSQIIVPPDIRNDMITDVFDAIEVSDFGEAPPRYSDNSVVTPEHLERARPVQIGPHHFKLNIGDDDAEVMLKDAGGSDFILDLSTLKPKLRAKVPKAYLGGS